MSQIQEEGARELIIRLLNLVEQLSADLRQAQQENQRLRDEIARLKGEKGKPNIKPNASPGNRDYSSEKERKSGTKPKDPAAETKEPKNERGIIISAAEVSNTLIKEQEPLHEEKAEIVRAGLESSPWQQTDDTATRVKGRNEHCHILWNPLYMAYFTRLKKDRQSVIDVLSNEGPRRYLFNEQATAYFQERRLGQRLMEKVGQLPQGTLLDEARIEQAIKRLPTRRCAC